MLVVWLIFLYNFILYKTSRILFHIKESTDSIINSDKPVIFCLWHNRLFIFPHFFLKYKRDDIFAIVSLHKDGKLLKKILESYKYKVISGSTRNGSYAAIKGAINAIRNNGKIFVTPDGPKGPIYKMNTNLIEVARKMDVKVVLLTYSATSYFKLNSWDNFIIPKPFSKIYVKLSEPINPKDFTNEEFESMLVKLTQDLDNELVL